MANYVKATYFTGKDSLITGNPAKIIKGAEIDDEFNAISTAIATKPDSNSPTLTGIPLAPTAIAGTNTTQIATTAFVGTAIANGIPSGVITMWSGSVVAIPTGFNLCDGTNGTPDLRNRFVVGAGSTYAVGATGGSADAVVVSHTHSATVTDAGHSHGGSYFRGDLSQFVISASSTSQIHGSGGISSATTGITVANSTTGVSGTNANLPPYYALCYIMKL